MRVVSVVRLCPNDGGRSIRVRNNTGIRRAEAVGNRRFLTYTGCSSRGYAWQERRKKRAYGTSAPSGLLLFAVDGEVESGRGTLANVSLLASIVSITGLSMPLMRNGCGRAMPQRSELV